MKTEKTTKILTVVCACIRRDGGKQVLLAVRHAPGMQAMDGRWELPGGKIEFGETPDRAIVREIREELGLEIEPLRLLPHLHTNIWEYEHAIYHVVLAGYDCALKTGSELEDTVEARWFNVQEIDFSTTLPGTREFISLAINRDWFDRLCIKLELSDPSSHTTRHFTLAAQPTLFSQYGLVKYWGTLGGYTRLKHEEFDSPKQMDARILEVVRQRLSHGYHLTGVEGRTERYEVLAEIIDIARAQGQGLTVN